jgi:Na+(H+)/acetate symporter ActP
MTPQSIERTKKLQDISQLATFSLAAAIFFPALALGLFWSGATARGAVAGMTGGALVTVAYMLHAWPHLMDAPSSAMRPTLRSTSSAVVLLGPKKESGVMLRMPIILMAMQM